jgi:regulator of replication initiation timing
MDQRYTSSYRSNHISSPSLEEENALLRVQCRRVGELEEKVEMVLKNNAQLLLENEKLAKMLHQQKADY